MKNGLVIFILVEKRMWNSSKPFKTNCLWAVDHLLVYISFCEMYHIALKQKVRFLLAEWGIDNGITNSIKPYLQEVNGNMTWVIHFQFMFKVFSIFVHLHSIWLSNDDFSYLSEKKKHGKKNLVCSTPLWVAMCATRIECVFC